MLKFIKTSSEAGLERAGWLSGNALNLYSVDARIESRPGHRTFSVAFFSSIRQLPGLYFE
jgi:hypothetical protein